MSRAAQFELFAPKRVSQFAFRQMWSVDALLPRLVLRQRPGAQRLTVLEIAGVIVFAVVLLYFGCTDARLFHCNRASANSPMHCGAF